MFSVNDIPDPNTLRQRAIDLSGAVAAEQAGANFRAATQRLRDQAAQPSRTKEEWQAVADGVRRVAQTIAEEPDRG